MEMIMTNNNKGLSIVFMFSLIAALSGCGETSDELDEKLTHHAQMSFVNGLDYMANFYLKKRNISTGYSGLFDSKNIVANGVVANITSDHYNYSYKLINNMINIGVRDSITTLDEQRITTTLSNDDNLWVIAWEASGDSALSVIHKKQNNNADAFNVRLFTNGNYDIYIDNVEVLTTEKGKVTNYLTIENCSGGLKLVDKVIDLCAGNLGASYLLVVNSNGMLVMAEE